MKAKRFILALTTCALVASAEAQSILYPQHFDLQEVTLTGGPLKTAMDRNTQLLLSYDVDRLLTPFVRQAGLKTGRYAGWESKHPHFQDWGSGGWRIDGHAGGHHLTAVSLAYAACRDEAVRAQLKQRIDYMVEVMKDCQDVFKDNTDGMRGYIGGQPINDIWPAMYRGDLGPWNQYGSWVIYYVQHKIMAGLRDAYVYGGNETARDCYLAMCDWAINVISHLSDSQVQNMLYWEHGGICEIVADGYTLTGDEKYLAGARRYCHQQMVNGMQGAAGKYSPTFLDGHHANTEIPKYIGFERISTLSGADDKLRTAATNFWHDVANHRTVCIGGNSIDEHFLSVANCGQYVTAPDGAESCNSNNMLKLSEMLFDRTHESMYADLYENTMWNHILSTQDPETGGYVYFTTLRPQSYRIYSTLNYSMWCCVGTGMENHSKYAHFAYTHDGEHTLYVNLFEPSELNNATFGLKQDTQFPFEPKTRLTITRGGTYTIAVRRPQWVAEGYELKVNGEIVNSETAQSETASEIVNSKSSNSKSEGGYAHITRTWQEGDVVDVALPMTLRFEDCPNVEHYTAVKYGPILLAAVTSEEGEVMPNEYAGTDGGANRPSRFAELRSLSSAPIMIGSKDEMLQSITMKDASTLTFDVPVRRQGENTTIQLRPFYGIHHARYSCYFWQGTAEEYAASDMGRLDAEEQSLRARTIDFVNTGEQQSEANHESLYDLTSTKGLYKDEMYRDAQPGGYIEYRLATNGETEAMALMCRYTVDDHGRQCQITIDGEPLTTVTVPTSANNTDEKGFYNVEFPIPSDMLTGKDYITVRFKANMGTTLPGLYYLRLVNGWAPAPSYSWCCTDWLTGDENRVLQSAFSYDTDANTITLEVSGNNNVCLMLNTRCGYEITQEQKYLVVVGQNLSRTTGKNLLWWLNGTGCGGVAPTKTQKLTLPDGSDAQLIAWDMTRSGINGNNVGERFSICQGPTIFGLTSVRKAPVTINYVGFNTTLDELTGIEDTHVSPIVNHNYYDLSGRRIASPRQPGIYIVGGKKYVK